MPQGSASITADAGSIPIAARPAIPAAAPRKPRRDVSICMDLLLWLSNHSTPCRPVCATPYVLRRTLIAVALHLHRFSERTRNMAKNTAVFGIYSDRVAVEEAVEHLRRAGFRATDMSVLFPENQGTKDFAHERNTKAPEAVTSGVV